MKKTLAYLFLFLLILGAGFAYVLYTEGAFERIDKTKAAEAKPFEMKCEAGKCGSGKCGGN